MSAIAKLKSGLFRGAWKSGLLQLVQNSAWRRSRLLILCYHGVSLRDEHEWSDLYVSPGHFERRLNLLSSLGVRVAPLGLALDELRDGTVSEPTVALTFDDGTADFALQAAPLLSKFRLPAMVYLTTYYAQRQLPVFDPWSAYLIWKGAGRRADLGPLGQIGSLPMRHAAAEQASLHARLRAACSQNGMTASDKDAVLRKLAASIDVSYDEYCHGRFIHIMNETEARSLPKDLIAVELHTHRHRSPANRAEFHEELSINERSIDELTGIARKRKHFCYPSGVYNGALRGNVASYSLDSATTCDPGLVSRDTDRLMLPRFVDTMSVSDATFTAWVTGAAAALPRRRASGASSL